MAVEGIIGIKLGMTQVFATDGTSGWLHGSAGRAVRGGSAPHQGKRWLRRRATGPRGIHQAAAGEQGDDRPLQEGQRGADAVLQEVRIAESKDETKVGDRVLVENFAAGELVDITGVSKGSGFRAA